ncbi:unnamed protein product, partial [Closterium sp. Naga37s-1]
ARADRDDLPLRVAGLWGRLLPFRHHEYGVSAREWHPQAAHCQYRRPHSDHHAAWPLLFCRHLYSHLQHWREGSGGGVNGSGCTNLPLRLLPPPSLGLLTTRPGPRGCSGWSWASWSWSGDRCSAAPAAASGNNNRSARCWHSHGIIGCSLPDSSANSCGNRVSIRAHPLSGGCFSSTYRAACRPIVLLVNPCS